VNPAVLLFLGWAFAGEQLGERDLAAGFVILSSIALLALSRDARRAAARESSPRVRATVEA